MAYQAAEGPVFLSTLPAQHSERRLALIAVLLSALMFVIAVPFAKTPLLKVWAFIPIYESALVINDLITAVLLFGQFNILRSRALFLLACGYLFTAFMTVAHLLTFPGAFSATGLLGAGPQSTAWMYMFWHGGFPLFVMAYVLLKDQPSQVRWPPRVAIAVGAAAVFAATCGFTYIATQSRWLPAMMIKNHFSSTQIFVIGTVWGLSMLALLLLWRRRRSALDLWLMVVLCAWIFDIGLSGVFNAGRFDLGFYAGRIYGLLAASFVLMVLLLESGLLYARLVQMHQSERQQYVSLMELAQRIARGDLSVSVQPQSEQDSLGQALAAMVANLRAKAEVAQRIALGDQAVPVVPLSEQDTLGQAFAAMLDNLQGKEAVAKRIALGDLSGQVQLQSSRDGLGQALQTMLDRLREMNREMDEGVDVLAVSAGSILSGTTQVAASAAEVATVLQQTSATVYEVKQTALLSSEKAKSVSEAAQQAAEVSQLGRQSVDAAIEGMRQIREQMELIAVSIVRLSEQNLAIAEIMVGVNELSEQSNRLAVNAAIEAAKAGEHGKGFAVVAQEVKNLAAQSKQATAKVRAILLEIQKATRSAVLTTEQGAHAVEQGMLQSQAAGEAIRHLAQSISDSAMAVSQIVVSAQQQLLGMDQLAQAMDNIKLTVGQNVDSTRQTEATAGDLNHLGQKLKGVLKRYKGERASGGASLALRPGSKA